MGLRERDHASGTRRSSTSIRFGAKALSIDDLVGFGAMNEDMRNYLRAAVISKCNVLVSGGTGAGKRPC